MHYMLLIYRSEAADPRRTDISPEVGAYIEDLRERKVLVASGKLQPTDTATTVRVVDGEAMLTDGPFAETREQLGGYFLVDCADLDEALALARDCPLARGGSVEVRPMLAVVPV